jgi:RHS repeat-associated protein
MQKLDDTGASIMSVTYDPFGNVIDGFLVGEYGFSTKPLINDLNWYYYGFRYYDPVTGRWPSRDPIEEWGGVNLYAKVGNNPLDFVDVLGLSANCCGGKELQSGQQCCRDQPISSSKECCSVKECIAKANVWFDNCYTGCNLGAATFTALGSVVSYGLFLTGVGVPAGAITKGITIGGTAAIAYFCRQDCRNTRDILIERCHNCGLR